MIVDLIGYEGLYKISSEGKIYSLHNLGIPKEVGFKGKLGYITVWLSKNSKRKIRLVHRLVAIHFIPNPNNYPIVLHLDNDPTNCHMDNLKWGTLSDNTVQMYRDGRGNKFFKENHPKPNLGKFGSNHPRSRRINQYDLDGNFIKEWGSAIEAGIALGINKGNITACCRGEKHHSRAGKYRWKFIN